MLLLPGPQPSPNADTWSAPPDPVLIAFILCLLIGIPMLGLFWIGCGELKDWWDRRGWRAKQNRRPLK